jgi:hypothetical protein
VQIVLPNPSNSNALNVALNVWLDSDQFLAAAVALKARPAAHKSAKAQPCMHRVIGFHPPPGRPWKSAGSVSGSP